MTIVPIGATAPIDSDLAQLLAGHGFEGVRVTLTGRTLILEGNVGSYEAKCRIETAARKAAPRLQSSLRVFPRAA
jgi:hypothetical protein